MNGGAISWSSKKQELVTLSTAKSEYVAATYTAKALWLRQIIGEVYQPLQDPITLYSDSQSAMALTKDGSYHARTKHSIISFHLLFKR